MLSQTEIRGTVFVGNIAVFCTEAEIHTLFSSCGEVVEIRLAKSDDFTKHLSYGFVKYSNVASAQLAIQRLNGAVLCGRTLKVGKALTRTSRDAAPKAPQTFDSASVHLTFTTLTPSVFVTEETIRNVCGVFGTVVDVVISKHSTEPMSGKQSGYGFVHFPMSNEGIDAAFRAADALADVIIDQVSYRCKISHDLEQQLRSIGRAKAAVTKPMISDYDDMQTVLLHREGLPQSYTTSGVHSSNRYAGTLRADSSYYAKSDPFSSYAHSFSYPPSSLSNAQTVANMHNASNVPNIYEYNNSNMSNAYNVESNNNQRYPVRNEMDRSLARSSSIAAYRLNTPSYPSSTFNPYALSLPPPPSLQPPQPSYSSRPSHPLPYSQTHFPYYPSSLSSDLTRESSYPSFSPQPSPSDTLPPRSLSLLSHSSHSFTSSLSSPRAETTLSIYPSRENIERDSFFFPTHPKEQRGEQSAGEQYTVGSSHYPLLRDLQHLTSQLTLHETFVSSKASSRSNSTASASEQRKQPSPVFYLNPEQDEILHPSHH